MFSNPYFAEEQRHDVYIYQPFIIFGFDIMIDENLKAWLLEINNNPDMRYIMCNDGMCCKHENCYESPVNKIVKKTLIHDCFELLVTGR